MSDNMEELKRVDPAKAASLDLDLFFECPQPGTPNLYELVREAVERYDTRAGAALKEIHDS